MSNDDLKPAASLPLVCRVEKELLKDEYYQEQSWRVFRMMAEFVSGFELLKKYHCAVSFFGSARCTGEYTTYQEAEELARKLSKAGFSVITGGASGIMEAANKGAYEAGGQSVGLNIELPEEQHFNKYLTESQHFHYFFTRKVMLSYASEVYVFFPGGYGTLDEFFEIITLIQTKKIDQVPIVLVGKDYWDGIFKWLTDTVVGKYKAISPHELELFYITDSVDEAYDRIMHKTVSVREAKNIQPKIEIQDVQS